MRGKSTRSRCRLMAPARAALRLRPSPLAAQGPPTYWLHDVIASQTFLQKHRLFTAMAKPRPGRHYPYIQTGDTAPRMFPAVAAPDPLSPPSTFVFFFRGVFFFVRKQTGERGHRRRLRRSWSRASAHARGDAVGVGEGRETERMRTSTPNR